MAFAHLPLNRRLMIVGAIAGVVMEAAVFGGFFLPRNLLPPIEGMSAQELRSLELLPFVLVGGVSLLVGVGCFVASMVLTATKGRRKKKRRTRSTQVFH